MSATMDQTDAVLGEVDGVLDTLNDMTGTMVTNAQAQGKEIKEQTEMAKKTNAHMDKTNDGINKATNKLVGVQKVSKVGIIPFIFIILFAVIGVVFFILGAMVKEDASSGSSSNSTSTS